MTMSTLQGRIALVTGATSGIGRAAAVRLARDGATIIATGRNQAEAERTLDAIRAVGGTGHFRPQDITDEAGWIELTDWIEATFGRLDVAVNCAGVFFSKPLPDTSLEDFRWIWNIDVNGCFLGIKHAMRLMRKTGSAGSIINISSLAGLIGLDDCAAYCAAKAAVTHLSKAAALEGAKASPRIRVNSLNPGVIMTEMITKSYGDTPETRAFAMQGNALQTTGEPEDIAAGVAYLAGDASRYVTGSVLLIDGGRGAD